MRRIFSFMIILVVIFGLTVSTHATLWDRGGLIYDDFLNITWLKDTDYAVTSGYTGGGMTWDQANVWAAQLVYGGYDDWRLPDPAAQPVEYIWGFDGTTTAGYNIITSEIGYMYYVNLNNKGYYDTSGYGPQSGWNPMPNASFTDGNGKAVSFDNLQSYDYWLAREYAPPFNPPYGGRFDFNVGALSANTKDFGYPAWAVRNGDVSAVPEPTTIFLVGLGLLGLLATRKKFKN
jgi:hypothetical protein